MARVLFAIGGGILALFPYHVRQVYETIFFRNPEDCSAKPTADSAVRVEGIAFLIAGLIGGRLLWAIKRMLILAGVLAIVFPNGSLDFSNRTMYENPEEIEWRRGTIPVVRSIGIGYLILGSSKAPRSSVDEQDTELQ